MMNTVKMHDKKRSRDRRNFKIRSFRGEKDIILYAPIEYYSLSIEDRKRIGNGCGAEGALIDYVPDTIWFLSIAEACRIHDIMYNKEFSTYEAGEYYREVADDVFYVNMIQIINRETNNKLLRWMRHHRAKWYHWIIRRKGDASYWRHKFIPERTKEK